MSLGLSIVLAASTVLVGQAPMATSPHGGHDGRGGHGAAAAVAPVRVDVRRVDASGALQPASQVQVLLERWTSSPARMGERGLDAVYESTTDAQGRARFPAAARSGGAELVASTIDDGLTRTASPHPRLPNQPIDLRLYEQNGTIADLEGLMQIDLSIRDGFVIVETAWTVRTTGRRIVLLDGDTGLRVPVALPAIFADSLDAGMLPNDTARRHLALNVTPDTGRLVVRGGAVFFEGHISPGSGTLIRVRYALPIVAERMDLAIRSPIDLVAFSLSSTWSDRVAPRIAPQRTFRAQQRLRAETIQRFLRVDDPPKAGEAMVIHVDRLPRPLDVHAAAAIGGSLVLLFLFGLAVMTGRRREP